MDPQWILVIGAIFFILGCVSFLVTFVLGIFYMNSIFAIGTLEHRKPELYREIQDVSIFKNSSLFDPAGYRGNMKWRYEISEKFANKLNLSQELVNDEDFLILITRRRRLIKSASVTAFLIFVALTIISFR